MECRKWLKEQKEQNNKKGVSKEDNKERVAAASEEVLIICEDAINFTCHESSQVIDSGASIHATSRRDFFSTYISSDYSVDRMGNYGAAKVIGMGHVCLETNIGCKLVLKNVRHIPDI